MKFEKIIPNQDLSEESKIKGGKFSGLISIGTTILSILLFLSIINIVNSDFEKIVICMLALILKNIKDQNLMNDTKEFKKYITMSSGVSTIISNLIYEILIYIILLSTIFHNLV